MQSSIVLSSFESQQLKSPVVLRLMTGNDLPVICRMETEYFASPWPESAFEAELAANYSQGYVLEYDGKIIGYAIAWYLYEECHIANIAVHHEFRNIGLGTWFVSEILNIAQKQGQTVALLEVRKSNNAAINLYQKLGFRTIHIRKNYYAAEKEDALIMACSLK